MTRSRRVAEPKPRRTPFPISPRMFLRDSATPRQAFMLLLAASVCSAQTTGIGGVVIGASEVKQSSAAAQSKLEFASSDARLVEGFNRAKRQAMAYVFDGDPVGPWYEAAEPGREAFCMRDTAHQAMGAHALGLARHNLNMLRRFAEAVSDARDWCSLWEIDRFNRPAPVDYQNDALFWFNLPANFDILDTCRRMYLWSGDPAYINDPAFLNFYDRTVTDYVERWGLAIDQILTRPRLLNMRGLPGGKKFQSARGIPGYDEGNHEYTVGSDLVATQFAAYQAYAQIQATRGNAALADAYFKKAEEVRKLIDTRWWNEKDQCFYQRAGKDHNLEGGDSDNLLYWGAVADGPKLQAAMAGGGRRRVEVLYRYGDPDTARERLLQIMTPGQSRMEYPEVPFSTVGVVVNGTMGIDLDAASALLSSVQGGWVEASVRTLSGLGTKVEWAELRNLPIRANEVTVRHEGTRKTIFTNQRGPAIVWYAAFAGTHESLLVNGKPVRARTEKATLGRSISSLRVTVGAGGTVTVAVPE